VTVASVPEVFLCGVLAGGGLASTAFLCLKSLRAWVLDDFERRMTALRAEHRTRFDADMADINRKHQARLAEIRDEHEAKIAEIRDRHEARILEFDRSRARR
jgi:hypothetical protein